MSNPRASAESAPAALTLSIAEAAELLGKSADWLGRAAAAGVVPSRKIGHARRFTPADLEDYLESCRQGQQAKVAGTSLSRSRRRKSA